MRPSNLFFGCLDRFSASWNDAMACSSVMSGCALAKSAIILRIFCSGALGNACRTMGSSLGMEIIDYPSSDQEHPPCIFCEPPEGILVHGHGFYRIALGHDVVVECIFPVPPVAAY